MNAPTQPNDGGPAFPQHLAYSPEGQANLARDYFSHADGMTLRDWFAGQAMQALIGTDPTKSHFWDAPNGSRVENWLSRNAYEIADAMIAARNNTNTTAQ